MLETTLLTTMVTPCTVYTHPHLLPAAINAVPEHDLALRVGQVPDARRAVSRAGGQQVLHGVPRADEDFLVVALEHARLLLWDFNTLLDRQLKEMIALGGDGLTDVGPTFKIFYRSNWQKSQVCQYFGCCTADLQADKDRN